MNFIGFYYKTLHTQRTGNLQKGWLRQLNVLVDDRLVSAAQAWSQQLKPGSSGPSTLRSGINYPMRGHGPYALWVF